jgi:hypothetical protein
MTDKEDKLNALKKIYSEARRIAVKQFKIEFPKYSGAEVYEEL